jgi:hypothetical protein
MSNARTIEIGTAIAEQLDQIERQLVELRADAEAIQFHAAHERLNRLRDRVAIGKKAHVGIDGRISMVACYRLNPGVKRAAKRR